MKFCIYSCTKGDDEKDTELYKSCVHFEHLDLFFKKNNTDGLSKSYNNFLYSDISKEYDVIVFCHDDLYLDDLKLEKKLETAMNKLNFDIVGLAGCVNPKISSPSLWHLMAGGFSGGNLRGAVGHYLPGNSDAMFVTNFGATPSRVALLDGLFLAVNVKKVKDVNWKFNENFKFHHYDIASCLDANTKKLRLGVYPIYVVHRSHGLASLDQNGFIESEKAFLKEYSS
jgi:hypothetical protein